MKPLDVVPWARELRPLLRDSNWLRAVVLTLYSDIKDDHPFSSYRETRDSLLGALEEVKLMGGANAMNTEIPAKFLPPPDADKPDSAPDAFNMFEVTRLITQRFGVRAAYAAVLLSGKLRLSVEITWQFDQLPERAPSRLIYALVATTMWISNPKTVAAIEEFSDNPYLGSIVRASSKPMIVPDFEFPEAAGPISHYVLECLFPEAQPA